MDIDKRMKKMKNKLLLIICMITLIISCKRVPSECEQLSDMIGEIPELMQDDYNDCKLVSWNYTYFARWSEDSYMEHYPDADKYLSQQGDTVLFKGFITHSYGDTLEYHNGYWVGYLDTDSLEAMNPDYKSCDLIIYSDNKDLFNDIDFSKKCYVKATVQFGNPLGFVGLAPVDHKSCYALRPDFKIIKIKN